MKRNKPVGVILQCKSYTIVDDCMTWPSYDQSELEWQLRYGSEQYLIAARLKLASIVSAYKELIGMPQNSRDDICYAIREAKEMEAQIVEK